MDQTQQNLWRDEALQEVLLAIAKQDELRSALIFKGARILNLHLGTHRQSLDIDTSLDFAFSKNMPNRDERIAWFQTHLETALRDHYEDQEEVRYTLRGITITSNPRTTPHHRGWDALIARIDVTNEKLRGNRNLPKLELEIAAPETLGENAVCDLQIDGASVRAYTLHRIAGEKLRAFLTSQPAYREKINSNTRTPRVKDLHDFARILRAHPISDEVFWKNAAHEFRLACESRYVDCDGPDAFLQRWEEIEQAYHSDPSLQHIPWEEAESALTTITARFAEWSHVFPLSFPLPP